MHAARRFIARPPHTDANKPMSLAKNTVHLTNYRLYFFRKQYATKYIKCVTEQRRFLVLMLKRIFVVHVFESL